MLNTLRHTTKHILNQSPLLYRPISSSSPNLAGKPLPPRPKPPPEHEIQESYLKGSGPGGQKINKTNSAVQLKHIPTGIVVKSQATRSRDQNRKHAREILAQRIDDHLNGHQSRSATVAAIKNKKSASADKKKRRKYRKLQEDQEEEQQEQQKERQDTTPGIDLHDEPIRSEQRELEIEDERHNASGSNSPAHTTRLTNGASKP